MNLYLNIGLNTPTGTLLNALDVRRAINVDTAFQVERTTHVVSDSEPTLVVHVSLPHRDPNCAPGLSPALRTQLSAVSELLQQDCIAAWNPDTAAGELIGPRAALWGQFDGKKFLLFDGQPLL